MATALAPDERATLEAALAFIEECYDNAGDAPAKKKATATRARNVAAAARTNRQKRAELLQLRELADELEATRDALAAATMPARSPSRRARGSGQDAGSLARRAASLARVAAAVAEREALRLRESRARNRRLRAALDEQRVVSAALVRVLAKRLEQKNDDATPLDRRSLCSDLHVCLRAFVEEANAALTLRPRERVLAESRTRAFRHATLGPVVEMVSSTLVPCDVDDAWSHMMHAYRNEIATANGHKLRYRFQSRPTTEPGVSEKEYAMEFPDRNEPSVGRVPVHGVALFEALTASDWRVFIWTAVVATRSDGTQVRERGWTAMAPKPAGHCVLRMRYEVYWGSSQTTQAETLSRSQQLQVEKEKFLAESLLQKARQDRIDVENALAARFGSEASCASALFA